MFSPVEAFLLLSYTGMVYVLSCRGFLDVIVHRDGVCSLLYEALSCRGFLLLSYAGTVYFLSCRGFLDVTVHGDGVCSPF